MIIDNQFQTPKAVCDYMVSMIPKNTVSVFEPTPGQGNLIKALEHCNQYKIHTCEDFFLHDSKKKYDCIIMNPPFSSYNAYMVNAPINAETRGMKIGYYILKECMKMSNEIIALMPWYTIADSDVRLNFLKSYGIVSLTALPRKTFKYARIQTCVMQLRSGYTKPTIFKTLPIK